MFLLKLFLHQCILQSYATFKFDSLVSACQVRPRNWGYRFTKLITAENADRFDVKYSWKTENATQLLCFLLQYWILSERKTRFAVSLFSQETRSKRSLDCQNSQRWGNIVHCHRQNTCLLAKTAKQSFFCVFKYEQAVKQNVWSEVGSGDRHWGETLKKLPILRSLYSFKLPASFSLGQ